MTPRAQLYAAAIAAARDPRSRNRQRYADLMPPAREPDPTACALRVMGAQMLDITTPRRRSLWKRLLGVACIALAPLLVGCDDPPGARRALEGHGFSDIQVGGWAALRCGTRIGTRFAATNPAGKHVTGTVCSSAFQGSTVRFD